MVSFTIFILYCFATDLVNELSDDGTENFVSCSGSCPLNEVYELQANDINPEAVGLEDVPDPSKQHKVPYQAYKFEEADYTKQKEKIMEFAYLEHEIKTRNSNFAIYSLTKDKMMVLDNSKSQFQTYCNVKPIVSPVSDPSTKMLVYICYEMDNSDIKKTENNSTTIAIGSNDPSSAITQKEMDVFRICFARYVRKFQSGDTFYIEIGTDEALKSCNQTFYRYLREIGTAWNCYYHSQTSFFHFCEEGKKDYATDLEDFEADYESFTSFERFLGVYSFLLYDGLKRSTKMDIAKILSNHHSRLLVEQWVCTKQLEDGKNEKSKENIKHSVAEIGNLYKNYMVKTLISSSSIVSECRDMLQALSDFSQTLKDKDFTQYYDCKEQERNALQTLAKDIQINVGSLGKLDDIKLFGKYEHFHRLLVKFFNNPNHSAMFLELCAYEFIESKNGAAIFERFKNLSAEHVVAFKKLYAEKMKMGKKQANHIDDGIFVIAYGKMLNQDIYNTSASNIIHETDTIFESLANMVKFSAVLNDMFIKCKLAEYVLKASVSHSKDIAKHEVVIFNHLNKICGSLPKLDTKEKIELRTKDCDFLFSTAFLLSVTNHANKPFIAKKISGCLKNIPSAKKNDKSSLFTNIGNVNAVGLCQLELLKGFKQYLNIKIGTWYADQLLNWYKKQAMKLGNNGEGHIYDWLQQITGID